jgi:hypothetical protein
MKNIYDFNTSSYFPWHVKLVGGGLVIIGIVILSMGMFIGGPLVLLVSTIIFTTHYRVHVNFDTNMYHDYLWILGMKSGSKNSFEKIEYIFIKESRQSQTMGLRATNTTVHKSVYDAYLKFSETNKIHLITKDEKKDVIVMLRPIADKLKTDIIDYTEGEPHII